MNSSSTKISIGEAIPRAIRLRCPRCGVGKLFAGWFRMNTRCPNCNLQYERAPGYFLGSTYVNYAFTALITTITFVALRFGWGIPGGQLLWPLLIFCFGFPVLFFRHARALWLGMDIVFDPSDPETPDSSDSPTPLTETHER